MLLVLLFFHSSPKNDLPVDQIPMASALVSTTALIGVFRDPAGGTKSAEESICCLRSGDAFRRNQRDPSVEMAA